MATSVLSGFLREAAKAGVVKGVAVGLAFLFFLVLARNMSPENYGVFAAAFSMATIVGLAASIGQHKAILRFWPALDEAYGPAAATYVLRRGLITSSLGAFVVVALFAGLSVSGIRFKAFGNEPIVVLLVGLFAATLTMADFAMSAFRARGRVATALLPREVLWRGIVVVTVFLSAGALSATSALVLVCGVLAAIVIVQLAIVVRAFSMATLERPPEDELRAFDRATPGFWGISIAVPLMQQGATLAIAFTLGPVAAGAFFAAERLSRLLSFALIGTNFVIAPMLSRSWRGGRLEEVKTLVSITAVLGALFAFAGLVGFGLFGKFALSLFDPTYREAWPALMVLCVAHLVNAACGPNGILLNMTGYERFQLLILSVWSVISIALAWIGALEYGLVGAALGTAVAMIGWNVTSVFACRRLVKVNTFSIEAFRKSAQLVRSWKIGFSDMNPTKVKTGDN